jgi:hypothetical protein
MRRRPPDIMLHMSVDDRGALAAGGLAVISRPSRAVPPPGRPACFHLATRHPVAEPKDSE